MDNMKRWDVYSSVIRSTNRFVIIKQAHSPGQGWRDEEEIGRIEPQEEKGQNQANKRSNEIVVLRFDSHCVCFLVFLSPSFSCDPSCIS